VLARASLAVLALAVAVWLALGYPGAHDEARATAILTTPAAKLPPPQRTQALSLLQSARRFRPDDTVVLREASVLTQIGRRARAAQMLRSLLRREPESVTGWALLAFADPSAVPEARAHERALAPPVP
jgi:predicted Zn-dependent protease